MTDPAAVRLRLIEAALSPASEDATSVADAAGAAFAAFCAELAALVGQRGVRSLYERSVHLASLRYPWLELLSSDPTDELSVDLQRRLAERSDDEASAASQALMTEFTALLASLIGDALTERLMRAAWKPHAQARPSPENPR